MRVTTALFVCFVFVLATAVLATALVPAVTAAQDPPDPDAPLSEQTIAATKLRERADRWFAVGSTAAGVALASALVGVVYDDELRENPTTDKAVVLGAGGGLAVLLFSWWFHNRLSREAKELLENVTVKPEPGGVAVNASLAW